MEWIAGLSNSSEIERAAIGYRDMGRGRDKDCKHKADKEGIAVGGRLVVHHVDWCWSAEDCRGCSQNLC